MLRDIIVGEVPPAALREVSYLLTAVAVAVRRTSCTAVWNG
jgi:uncharacterized membrane protein YeiH